MVFRKIYFNVSSQLKSAWLSYEVLLISALGMISSESLSELLCTQLYKFMIHRNIKLVKWGRRGQKSGKNGDIIYGRPHTVCSD